MSTHFAGNVFCFQSVLSLNCNLINHLKMALKLHQSASPLLLLLFSHQQECINKNKNISFYDLLLLSFPFPGDGSSEKLRLSSRVQRERLNTPNQRRMLRELASSPGTTHRVILRPADAEGLRRSSPALWHRFPKGWAHIWAAGPPCGTPSRDLCSTSGHASALQPPRVTGDMTDGPSRAGREPFVIAEVHLRRLNANIWVLSSKAIKPAAAAAAWKPGA